MSDPEPSRAGLPGLTGARGIAAWFVVLYHVRPGLSASASPEFIGLLGKGYLAVDFFFMLSGFVLWLNYADKLRAAGLSAAPGFLARRIARIWPLHLVVLAGAVALALVLQASGRQDPGSYPWAELPLHILLLQNWGFTSTLSWNDPAWSISCEWAAYLLFPLLALAINWRRVPSALLVAIIALLALILHAAMANHGARTLGVDIPRFGLLRALIEFGIGTMVCSLWQRWQERPSSPATIGLTASIVLAVLTATGTLPETFTIPLAFAALLLGLSLTAAHPANPVAWRPIVYLGEISYATYLVHFLLYVAFKLLFVDDPFAVPLPLLAAFLLLTFTASTWLHHLVELPAQRGLRRLFEPRPRERCAAAAL